MDLLLRKLVTTVNLQQTLPKALHIKIQVVSQSLDTMGVFYSLPNSSEPCRKVVAHLVSRSHDSGTAEKKTEALGCEAEWLAAIARRVHSDGMTQKKASLVDFEKARQQDAEALRTAQSWSKVSKRFLHRTPARLASGKTTKTIQRGKGVVARN